MHVAIKGLGRDREREKRALWLAKREQKDMIKEQFQELLPNQSLQELFLGK